MQVLEHAVALGKFERVAEKLLHPVADEQLLKGKAGQDRSNCQKAERDIITNGLSCACSKWWRSWGRP